MNNIQLQVDGLKKLAEKMNVRKPAVQVISRYFNAVGTAIASQARRLAPVDEGALRRSINHLITVEDQVVTLSVGTNIKTGSGKPYPAYMEYGTGLQHDHPNWPRQRHYIPEGVLDGWGKRKGVNVEAFRRWFNNPNNPNGGGLKPRRFLRTALAIYRDQVRQNYRLLAQRIINRDSQ